METQDVLADDVHVGRPVASEVLRLPGIGLIGIVTQRRDIVRQRVQPDIHNMAVVKVDGNAPLERSPGYAEILQASLEEVVDHFLFPQLGLNEVGVLVNVGHQTVGILAHFEKVRLLLCLRERRAAVGALAALRLRCGKKGFAGRAIPPLVFAFVNVPLLIETAEDFLNGFDMGFVGCADEVVIACVHQIPDPADFARNAVHIRLRGDPLLFGVIFNLLPVLVRSRAEKDVLAERTLIARNGVRHNHLVGIAEVRLARSIRNRGCQIVAFFHVFILRSKHRQ